MYQERGDKDRPFEHGEIVFYKRTGAGAWLMFDYYTSDGRVVLAPHPGFPQHSQPPLGPIHASLVEHYE